MSLFRSRDKMFLTDRDLFVRRLRRNIRAYLARKREGERARQDNPHAYILKQHADAYRRLGYGIILDKIVDNAPE
jgi:hypothetical protein